MKLGGVNCLIQILLQTHNLQRIIFRIFSYQSRKLISNKAKKITKLAWMGSSSHLPQTGIKGFWISSKSSFPFFSRCFAGPFYISWFCCCVSILNVSFMSSVGIHGSLALHTHIPSIGGILLNIFSKMLWFILHILKKLYLNNLYLVKTL